MKSRPKTVFNLGNSSASFIKFKKNDIEIYAMIKYPIILVISEGSEPPEKIIKNIRKQSESENVEKLVGASCTVNGYKLHLTTKYYETDLLMVPFRDDVALLPPEIREAIEAALIYFDAEKRSFTEKIPSYADFLKENCIELGILLCDRLYDNTIEGITYKEAKQASRFLDVIELGRKREEGEDEDPHDPIGYEEVMQAIKSFLWSNVQMKSNKSQHPNSKATGSSSPRESQDIDDQFSKARDNSIENELEIFDRMLTEVMRFKDARSSMTKNERLAYSEQIANQFDDLIGEDPDSSDER